MAPNAKAFVLLLTISALAFALAVVLREWDRGAFSASFFQTPTTAPVSPTRP